MNGRRGFFAGSELAASKRPPSTIAKCGACGLYKQCRSPKMPVSGEGRRGVLIVGEAPGKNEDRENLQFVGDAGKLLSDTLRAVGVDFRRDCWVTNAIICRPADNRTPTPKEVEYCRPNLLATLKQLKPKTVICLGGTAVRSVVGYTWKENVGAISRWVGWNIPDRTLNAWICPTYHPSYLNRTGEHPLLFKFFKEHLAQAFTHDDRPWPDGPPDLREQIEIEEDVDRAARVLDWMRERGGPIAFDYESNALKPDDERAIIVSCAVCWRGKRTIAYPWQGRAIDATRRLLRSDCPKIGANIKHEDRWTRTKLGCAVRNWVWCCLIGAHVLDNRPDITSVKFQSYVHLGMPSYNDPLEKYLKSGKNTSFNRILSEVSMVQLLEYNGLDALLEYMLAIKQAKLMKFKLFGR